MGKNYFYYYDDDFFFRLKYYIGAFLVFGDKLQINIIHMMLV